MGVEVSWIPGQGTKIPDASRPKKKKGQCSGLKHSHDTLYFQSLFIFPGRIAIPIKQPSFLRSFLFILFFFFFARSILTAVMGIDTNSERNETKATRGKS